jgi:hypothetical protein
MPAFLTGRGQSPAHVALRFAGFEQVMHGQGGQGIGQPVPHPFELAAQHGVVENEATIIFQDAQRFAGPIGRGVQDAS